MLNQNSDFESEEDFELSTPKQDVGISRHKNAHDLIERMTPERQATMRKHWLLRICMAKLKRQYGFAPEQAFRFPAELAFVTASLVEQIENVPGLARSLHRDEPVIVAISTKEADLCELVNRSLRICFDKPHRPSDKTDESRRKFAVLKQNTTKLSERRSNAQSFSDFDSALKEGGPLILLSPKLEDYFRPEISRYAVHHFDVSKLSADGFRILLRSLFRNCPALENLDASDIRMRDFAVAMRSATSVADVGDKLVDLKARGSGAVGSNSANIHSLHGYGPAKEWASNLVADIAAYQGGTITWDEIDSKLLLVGPPGTGKTTFAKAVANALGIRLFTGSVAKWNATGDHLGHTLSAIRKSFEEARAEAPCLLLLDELDGISSRSALKGDHIEYWTQVVNLLLEELDGTISNKGVVIIGATNFADKIDPALLRSGRLDRTITLSLPDRSALNGILRGYLGSTIADTSLDRITKLMEVSRFSGADVEVLVKRAKGEARRRGKPLAIDDLLAQLPPQLLTRQDPVVRWSIAIHESAHAVVAHVLMTGTVKNIVMHGAGGQVTVSDTSMISPTRQDMENQLSVILAGFTAEEVLCGAENVMAGSENDLVKATSLATAMEASMGFGDAGLLAMPSDTDNICHLPFVNSTLRSGVIARLSKAKTVAADIITKHKAAIFRVAAHLLEYGEIEGDTFKRLFDSGDKDVPAIAPDVSIALAARSLVEAHMGCENC